MENLLPTAATLLAAVSPRAAEQTVESTDIPLWSLIMVVVGGTVLLVTALALPLVCARRRRRQRERRAGFRKRAIVIDGREVSVYGGKNDGSSGGGGSWGSRSGGGKLRKKNWEAAKRRDASGTTTTASERDGDGEESGNEFGASGISLFSSPRSRSVPSMPPVLPQLFAGGRRFSASVFSLVNGIGKPQSQRESTHSGQQSSHRRATSNAWVDEDALHGPVMNVSPSRRAGRNSSDVVKTPSSSSRRGKRARVGSWRHSFRENWPLKSLSPTIPRLAHFGSPKLAAAEDDEEKDQEDAHRPEHKVAIVAHEDVPMFRYQTHLGSRTVPSLAAPERGAEDQSSPLGYSPPRQLPKPPRQALLAASAEVAGSAHERSSSWHGARGTRSVVVPRDRGMSYHASYYAYEDGGGTPTGGSSRGAALRGSPMSRGRRATSTDSKLTQVLEGTQRRLQEGAVTGTNGGWGQGRMSASPSKRSLGPSAMTRDRPGPLSIVTGVGNESSATLVGTVSTMTPSPQKLGVINGGNNNNNRKSRHIRQTSKDSITSEPDSLLAPQHSPGLDHYHGLTSPTKGGLTSQPKQQRKQHQQPPRLMRSNSLPDSLTSSVDDSVDDRSLSDIHERISEELAAAEETRFPSTQGSGIPSTNKIGGFSRTTNQDNYPLDDPFISLRNSPARSARESDGDGHLYPVRGRGGVHAFDDSPRLLSGPTNRSEITLHSLRSESPLSTISGNSRPHSPDLVTRRCSVNDRISPIAVTARIQPWSTPQQSQSSSQAQGQRGSAKVTPKSASASTAPPTSAVSSSSNLHRRQLSTVHDGDEDDDKGVTVPKIALTTPSDKSGTSPLAKRVTQLIRARASSPTLGRSREHTPDIAPPSHALPQNSPRLPKPGVHLDPPAAEDNRLSFASGSTTTTHRRAAGEVRKISEDTTASASSSRYSEADRDRTDATNDFSTLMVAGDKGAGPTAMQPSQTIRLVPREETCLLPVSSTVSQLRRMNSQVAYSYYSDGTSANNSPVLPTLREEETGRFVSPPRKREAARNYLALGSTPDRTLAGGGGSTGPGAGPVGGERRYRDDFSDKENERTGDGLDSKLPNMEVGEHVTLRKSTGRTSDTPTRKSLRPAERSPDRSNAESPGLYDRDGFWISPERRANRQR